MLYKKAVAIISSAFICFFALLYPYNVGWLIFFLSVPLWYSIVMKLHSLHFGSGFLWGISFFGPQLYLVCCLPSGFFHAELIMQLSYIVLMLYFSSLVGCWFWLTTKITQSMPKNLLLYMITWALSLALLFWWLITGSLVIIGLNIGYPIANPLLALAAYPGFTNLISYCGTFTLIFCLISWPAPIFVAAKYRLYWPIIITALLISPFFLGFFSVESHMPNYLEKFGHIKPRSPSVHPLDDAQELFDQIVDLIEKNPKATILLTPESAYRFSINNYPNVLQLLMKVLEDKTLILGSYRSHDDKCFNTVYQITNCGIVHHYDKNYLVPFVEYIPSVWQQWIQRINSTLEQNLTKSLQSPPIFCLGNELKMHPRICADLFLGGAFLHKEYHNNYPMLLLVNDAWSSHTSMGELMVLMAVLHAQQLCRDILYVGYHQLLFINKSGCIVKCLS